MDIPEMVVGSFLPGVINIGLDKIISGEHLLFPPDTKAFIPAE